MKKISLFAAIAAATIFGFVACQKVSDPDQQEIAQAEQPGVKAIARILNETAEQPEVQEAVKNLLLDIKKGSDWHHLAFSVGSVDELGDSVNYVSGEIGLIKGEKHLLELDLNLMVVGFVPIQGSLDLLAIGPNFAKAVLALTDEKCDEYLEKANEGIKIAIFGQMKLALMRTEDEEGNRMIDLFLVGVDADPVPLSSILALLTM